MLTNRLIGNSALSPSWVAWIHPENRTWKNRSTSFQQHLFIAVQKLVFTKMGPFWSTIPNYKLSQKTPAVLGILHWSNMGLRYLISSLSYRREPTLKGPDWPFTNISHKFQLLLETSKSSKNKKQNHCYVCRQSYSDHVLHAVTLWTHPEPYSVSPEFLVSSVANFNLQCLTL